jgi:hypothetical protein
MTSSGYPPHDVLSRYECKYLLPKEMLPELRLLIRPFVDPDRHALRHPENRYPIGSLYLDTPDLFLHRQTEHGEKNRYKLRIRAYDDDPAGLVFFEVKRRMNGVVLKWRRAVRRSVASRFLDRQPLQDGPRDRAPDLAEFVHDAWKIDAGPVFRVRYEREAYEARGGEPTRVTFDTKLAFNPTTEGNLSLNGPGWERALQGRAILEVKFTERFPSWIQGIVDTFDLQRISVPKYGISVNRALALGLCTVPVLRHRSVVTGA